MQLLKRKGDVLVKVYSKLNQKSEFIQQLVAFAGAEQTKARQFSMYAFGILSDLELDGQELAANKNDFMQIFDRSIQDSDINVRVAAFKAISAFISGIDDSQVALGFAPVLSHLLNVIVEALQTDEDQGREALQSMAELTSAHPECWKTETSKLLNVTS